MTRKDYQKFAEMLKKQMEEVPYSHAYIMQGTIKEIADIFQRDNPRFNRQRFYEACGLEE